MRDLVKGDRELIRVLKTIDTRMETKGMRKANSKAIRPVVRVAKAGVRGVSKTISKAIGVRHKAYKSSKAMVSVVGIRNVPSVVQMRPHINPFNGAWSYRKHDPRHTAHLVEGGTKPHAITMKHSRKQRANHPGTKPHPFLKPAMERNEAEVTRLYREVLRSEILAAAIKQAGG